MRRLETIIRLPTSVIQEFRRFKPLDPKDAAEMAKLDVIQALTPDIFSPDEVYKAVADSRTSNGVSRAVRTRLPHRQIK